MELALLTTLLVLALVDATSVGTLGIPVWLALQPRVRSRAIVTYLAAIAVFYWVVGLVLYAGAVRAFEALLDSTEGDVRSVLQLLLGVALFALSFKVDPIGGRRRRKDGGSDTAGSTDATVSIASPARRPTRLDRLKERLTGEEFGGRAAITLASVAATLELAMMLPYLAAIGMLADASPGAAPAAGVLLAYAAVMVAPAAVLVGARVVAARRAGPLLARVQDWVDRHTAEALGLALGIGGFLLAGNAARGLGLGG